MYTAEEWEALHRETAEAGSKLNRQSVVPEDDAVKLEAMVVKQEGSLIIGKAPKERKGLTLKERLEICQATERQRLTFCKVNSAPCDPQSRRCATSCNSNPKPFLCHPRARTVPPHLRSPLFVTSRDWRWRLETAWDSPEAEATDA